MSDPGCIPSPYMTGVFEQSLMNCINISFLTTQSTITAHSYPLGLNLPHDVVGYFKHNHNKTSDNQRELKELPAGTVEVSEPDSMVDIDDTYLQYDSHQFFW